MGNDAVLNVRAERVESKDRIDGREECGRIVEEEGRALYLSILQIESRRKCMNESL
jgi:hypothetical protein